MKLEVIASDQGCRQTMHSEAAPPPPVNLPSRRRLMLQQLERHADHFARFDQVQEPAVEHYIDNDHSLQEQSSDDLDHQKMARRSSLRAKYGLAVQAYNDNHLGKYTNEHQQEVAAAHSADRDFHGQQQETAAADHYRKRGLANVSALRAKYGLANHTYTDYSDHLYDQQTDDDLLVEEDVADEHGSRTAPAADLKSTKPHRAPNSHPHDKHIEGYAVDHQLMQQDFKADHKGSRIGSSTLHAAQAQAAQLRALHSAMLNNYGIADRSSAASNNHHYKQKQDPDDASLHKSKPKKASKKKSRLYSDEDPVEEVQNTLSSTSSASSMADCFIHPAHEYPIFMPSHEDMNSMNRRSSVDNYDALMREERLNYIFDHDNKRTFSGMQYSDRFKRDSNVSCLHESLNLPPRSASSLMHLPNRDDQVLHHMSLNLPQGSQPHLFSTNNYKENPLFDHFNPNDNKASFHPMNALDGTPYSSSIKRFNDNNLHSAALNKPMDQYAYEVKAAFTGRQRALLEFLSEEPARMRAFNELAATETPEYDKAQMQRTNRKDAAALAEGNLSSSRRTKGNYASSTQNVDHLQSSRDNDPHHQLSTPHLPHPMAPSVRQKLAHTPNVDHSDHSINSAGISFDKCRPVAGGHTVIVPVTDSRELGSDQAAFAANTAASAVPKEKHDQKKPSIKGWFFRGKKKQNINADLSHSQANPAPISASKDRIIPITSGASSTTKEKQSSASTTSTTAATSSQVFSSLINSEAEKELEVAMAMDLMELKVLQANTKRDAAMAEVLELRLAMDSMAKKLVEVERHCEALRTQLIDVQAVHHQDHQILVDLQSNAPAAGMISTADRLMNVNADDPGAGAEKATSEETDHYESDSIDHLEERRPSKGISMIRSGAVSSGYSGRSSSRCVQPTKAEFFNAVAEARVGIRQVSRVLLQHIQESKGLLQVEADHEKAGGGIKEEGAEAGGTADTGLMKNNEQGGLLKKGRERESWGPILIMCREAAKGEKTGMMAVSGGGGGGGGRGRGVAYCVEALISIAFHEDFENIGFDKNGAHKILDPSQRALAFYHSFLKLAKLTPTQLLTQPSPLYNSAFDHFCSRKMRALGRAVGCPGRLWPDELARTFLSAARAVWLLHHLAFAYHGRPPGIFRVAAHSPFDARFMEVLPSDYRHVSPSSTLLVSLMVMPGFFLPDDIIKCKVLAN